MGEIWGRNGRETAVAEWRWAQMTITDAWDAVIQMQGQRALEQALEGFRSALAIDPSSEQPWELPTSSEGPVQFNFNSILIQF